VDGVQYILCTIEEALTYVRVHVVSVVAGQHHPMQQQVAFHLQHLNPAPVSIHPGALMTSLAALLHLVKQGGPLQHTHTLHTDFEKHRNDIVTPTQKQAPHLTCSTQRL